MCTTVGFMVIHFVCDSIMQTVTQCPGLTQFYFSFCHTDGNCMTFLIVHGLCIQTKPNKTKQLWKAAILSSIISLGLLVWLCSRAKYSLAGKVSWSFLEHDQNQLNRGCCEHKLFVPLKLIL